MTKVFKCIGFTAIMLFSFYYTEKLSNAVIYKSSLVSIINERSDEYNIQSVSAIIEGDYIIPGLNGEVVNVLESYNNMKDADVFNSYYLVYDVVTPSISLKNNLDKIIKYGNSNKNSISIVINNNEEIIEYASYLNIQITRIVNMDTFASNASYEQINNDFNNYSKVESLLNKSNLNNNICIVNNSNLEYCQNKGKYLVEYSTILTNYNLSIVKSNISSGYIIFIEDNVSVTDFKLLLKQIYYQDLNVVYLSSLISEER